MNTLMMSYRTFSLIRLCFGPSPLRVSLFCRRWFIMEGLTDGVRVSPVSDEDIPACFQVLSKSFGHDAPFVDVLFPNHDTPSGQAKGSKRLREWKQTSKDSTFLKTVVQASPGKWTQITGFAIWTLMKKPPPEELDKAEDVEEVWPDEDDRQFATRLWRDYVKPRSQAIRESDGRGVYGLL